MSKLAAQSARRDRPATRVGPAPVKLAVYLRRVGVEREELFTTDATRKAITWHDLRATGITWCAVRGDEALKLKQRAGHSGFATTEVYIREAENMRAGFGVVFPPLPLALSKRGPVRPTPVRVSAFVSAFGVVVFTKPAKTC